MKKTEWLKARQKGIGGSDAASVIGQNPWKSNVQLWEEKTGQRMAEDISENEYVQYGQAAEEYLRKLFCLDYPQYQVIHEKNSIITHPDYSFLLASLDGILQNKETGERGILEIKTANLQNSNQFEKWNYKIPQVYYIQCLHYLLVTQYDFAILKAQLKTSWNDDIRLTTRHYFFTRREVLEDIEFLKQKEIEFWMVNVLQNQRPALILPEI